MTEVTEWLHILVLNLAGFCYVLSDSACVKRLTLKKSDDVVFAFYRNNSENNCKYTVTNESPNNKMCIDVEEREGSFYDCYKLLNLHTDDPELGYTENHAFDVCYTDYCSFYRTFYIKFKPYEGYPVDISFLKLKVSTKKSYLTTTYVYKNNIYEVDYDDDYSDDDDGISQGGAILIAIAIVGAFCCCCTVILSKTQKTGEQQVQHVLVPQTTIADVTQAPHSRQPSGRSTPVPVRSQADEITPPLYYQPSAPPDYETLIQNYHNNPVDVNIINSGRSVYIPLADVEKNNPPPPPAYEEVIENMDKYVKSESPVPHNERTSD